MNKMSQHTVAIEIANRKLKVACPVGQETSLLCAAKEVTDRLEIASKSSKATNTPEQAMLMTALNLANDLLELRKEMEREKEDTKSKIELLQSTIEQVLHAQANKSA